MLTINTNVASLNSQRNLSSSQSALNTTLQRLSSGLRINSAKDDAAGLAISERMSGQIRGMDQARRNANDGISMAQTAEGALASSGDILQRIRELAVQSSNASNSASDRKALQAEVGQLTSELDRVAQTTEFNGQKLLDGSSNTLTYQVGANSGQTIQAAGSNFRTSNYGNNNLQVDGVKAKDNTVGASNIAATTAKLTISGQYGTKTFDTVAGSDFANDKTGETAATLAAKINAESNSTGVTASAKTEVSLDFSAAGNFKINIISENTQLDATGAMNGADVSFSVGGAGDTATDYAEAIQAINAVSGKTGVTAEFDATNKALKLTNASGNDIQLKNAGAASTPSITVDTFKADGTLAGAQDIKAAGAASLVTGRITFDSDKSFSVDDQGTGLALSGVNAGASSLQSVSSVDVSTFSSSQDAIKIIDSALQAINGQRAQFGALQSRFESTISNLQSSSENLSASRSRIQDADFASETAKLTKNQVLQQAGTAMLAQANQLPQGVLSLLR
ncbi:flagellin [Vogesella sp. GCM10023246]|uniref:Flagellin n=1 Tax=Vogesella oryzagri TaxID=3160864 RepID=A0ABV1M5V3_9NEIS